MGGQMRLRAATGADLSAMQALLAAESLPVGGVAEGMRHFHVLEDGQT